MANRNSIKRKIKRSYNRRRNLPKRRCTAYNLFVSEMRLDPCVVGPLWQSLSPLQKKKYQDVAEQLKNIYDEEKKKCCQTKPEYGFAFIERDTINKEKKEPGEICCTQTLIKNNHLSTADCFNLYGVDKNIHDSMNEPFSFINPSQKIANNVNKNATRMTTDIDAYPRCLLCETNVEVSHSNIYNSCCIDSTSHHQCMLDAYDSTEPEDHGGMITIDSETLEWLQLSSGLDYDCIDNINPYYQSEVDGDDPMDNDWLTILLEDTVTPSKTKQDVTTQFLESRGIIENTYNYKHPDLLTTTVGTNSSDSTDIIVSTTDPNHNNAYNGNNAIDTVNSTKHSNNNNNNNETKDENDTSYNEREKCIYNCYYKNFASSLKKKHSYVKMD